MAAMHGQMPEELRQQMDAMHAACLAASPPSGTGAMPMDLATMPMSSEDMPMHQGWGR
jgi:hypothetical protein